MHRLSPLLLLLGTVAATVPAQAQFDGGGGPTGDFRKPDRPITAPTLPSDAVTLPPNPMRFLDVLGSKSPDDVLKSLDKDLGQPRERERPKEPARDLPKAPTPGEDLGKRPAVPDIRSK